MTYAVCAIARLENHYIREWVEHYKKLGFTNIVLYDNNYDGEEYFEEVINDYIESGFVILKDYRNKKSTTSHNIQIEAYQECYNEGKFDWEFFCDIDEFLILDNNKTIDEFCNSPLYKNYNAIRICWKYYDDNGLIDTGDNYNCLTRFTVPTNNIPRQENQNNSCKTLIKTGISGVKFLTAHLFNHGIKQDLCENKNIKLCDAAGKNCKQTFLTSTSCFENAWLNHYRFKTIKEYIEGKQTRLWPDTYKGGGKQYLNFNTFFMFNKKTKEKEAFIRNYKAPAKVKHEKPKINKEEQIKQTPKTVIHKTFTMGSPNKPLDTRQQTFNKINLILSNANKSRLLNKLR